MECLNKLLEYNRNHPGRISLESVEEYIKLLAPVTPHVAEELWHYLDHSSSIFEERWPEYNSEYTKQDTMTIVIQVNGKLRDKLCVPTNTDQKKIEQKALESEKVKSFIDSNEVKKVIYVPGKLINIVIK
jgi:leucyl-tRNA synthetase